MTTQSDINSSIAEKVAFSFSGEAAQSYDQYLGPLLFEPFSMAVASVAKDTTARTVLELAAGSGRLTKHLRENLPPDAHLIATDISEDMLAIAKSKLKDEKIEFQYADIMNLPFEDKSFDLVFCQYGLMFLPDKQKGFNEIYRVLKPGGRFIFATWDSAKNVPIFNLILNETLIPFFNAEDNTKYLVPFSLHNEGELLTYMKNAGFSFPEVKKLTLEGQTSSPDDIVQGFLLKHALRAEVEAIDPKAVNEIADKLRKKIAAQFGSSPVKMPLTSLIGSGTK
jgi:ubiquinone/menaquinone biosynthesis C-methylase UbiE